MSRRVRCAVRRRRVIRVTPRSERRGPCTCGRRMDALDVERRRQPPVCKCPYRRRTIKPRWHTRRGDLCLPFAQFAQRFFTGATRDLVPLGITGHPIRRSPTTVGLLIERSLAVGDLAPHADRAGGAFAACLACHGGPFNPSEVSVTVPEKGSNRGSNANGKGSNRGATLQERQRTSADPSGRFNWSECRKSGYLRTLATRRGRCGGR